MHQFLSGLFTIRSGIRASLCLLMDHSVHEKREKDYSSKQLLAPMVVLIDLCFKKGSHDGLLTSLIQKVKQKKVSLAPVM